MVGLKEFAHPAKEKVSALLQVGSAFFLAFSMFGFVLQMGSLVVEKELKLRQVCFITLYILVNLKSEYFLSDVIYSWLVVPQALSMTGLYESAYWLSWIIWDGILAVISSLLLVLFGMMFQFDFFKKNNFAVVFLLFFLFQLNMVRQYSVLYPLLYINLFHP